MSLCEKSSSKSHLGAFLLLLAATTAQAKNVATWLFDEPRQSYPSSILNDSGPNSYVAVLGRGARLVPGRFGNALEPGAPSKLQITGSIAQSPSGSAATFGLSAPPIPPLRKIQPLWWGNATFAALLTSGEKHLRSGGFANSTDTKLNLGQFDWTVEFWFASAAGLTADGVVFELGEGPRGENTRLTRLSLATQGNHFRFENQPSNTNLLIPTDGNAVRSGQWHHFAFVFTAAKGQLLHYVDGRLQTLPPSVTLHQVTHGEEAYFSIGRDGLFDRPLPGRIDELRFRDDAAYLTDFTPPESFSLTYSGKLPQPSLRKGPPLLFGKTAPKSPVIDLGTRNHLFLDNALLDSMTGISFTPNPPRRIEQIASEVRGHLSVVEDETGLIRIYYLGPKDSLAVMTSRDGVHWDKPDTGHNAGNIVLPKPVGLGAVILDPNAPPESRYKYISGIRRQAIFVFYSRDGYWFTQHETAALPFAAGSQSAAYYDDQRGLYVAHHRSDYGITPGGTTRRRYVLSEVTNLWEPWPWERITPERTRQAAKTLPIQSEKLDPWFLDNGPLTPSGFGIELPTIFDADPSDPPGTDIYTTKAVKYPWAPDAYVAFPAVYFHYDKDGPPTRQALGGKQRAMGSGVVETQLAVSRDGLSWKRYPRPAYVPIGGDGSNREHMLFVTHGLVRRGNEIWQFVGGHGGSGTGYHSPYDKNAKPAPLYRYVQRLDGFIAAESAYTGATMRTRPLRFQGSRLTLNIDTGATGYAQIGFVDEQGKPIPGFSVDDCVYINGDFLAAPVEWLNKGGDVSSLAGKTVRLVFRMRASKLFAMQFQTPARQPSEP